MRLYKIDFDTRHPSSGPRVYEKNVQITDGAIRSASNGVFICESADVGVIKSRGACFTGFVTQRQQVDEMVEKIRQKVDANFERLIKELNDRRRAAANSRGCIQWES